MRQILLTFDTEDFINENSIRFLHSLLLCLERHELKALFFITGHMAEKLEGYDEVTNLLKEHEIGFHSSSHSVHPTIFEFTDVESYKEAYETALVRETSHINPLNGQIEGKGGILTVRALFRGKPILAYRAPGFCWSPPHSEALRDLGLIFDFSANIASFPIWYKGLTFYPYYIIRDWRGSLRDYRMFLSSALKRQVSVLCLHPSFFATQYNWDSIYHRGNPERLSMVHPRINPESKSTLHSFDLFLRRLKDMEILGLMQITPSLKTATIELMPTNDKVEKTYAHSMRWPRLFFNYEPKFLRSHFHEFFSTARASESAGSR